MKAPWFYGKIVLYLKEILSNWRCFFYGQNDIIKQQAAIIEALQKEINELNKTFKDTDTKLKETQAFVENQKFEI